MSVFYVQLYVYLTPMVQIPPLETDTSLSWATISQKVHGRLQKKPPLYAILSQFNPLHIRTSLHIERDNFQHDQLLNNVEDHNLSAVREFLGLHLLSACGSHLLNMHHTHLLNTYFHAELSEGVIYEFGSYGTQGSVSDNDKQIQMHVFVKHNTFTRV